MDKLEFLKSTRFWVMVAGAIAVYLSSKGIIGDNEMKLIATLSAGFIGVRTLDRAAEVIGTPQSDESK